MQTDQRAKEKKGIAGEHTGCVTFSHFDKDSDVNSLWVMIVA
jgi:hypothetical protein